MLEALALLRQRGETGALFVVRGLNGRGVRKEIYLENGRLHHVVSSERNELLGEYLVRRGSLSRQDLERALAELDRHQGRLGDTLIALELCDGVDLFRAIRDQGRDRVAALCAWKDGLATFYRGTQPARVDFPLDLDLANAMMAGIILRHEGNPRKALPADSARLVPGKRFETTRDPKELGRAPASLQRVARLTTEELSVERVLSVLTDKTAEAPAVGEREAAAAVATAELLGWARLVSGADSATTAH
jgi:eukaryotic-like serine/threonine-protein kinase